MIAAAMAAAVLVAKPATAEILSINLFSGSPTANCEDTISGSGCAPVGVTKAGAVTNPFLNDLNSKEINLAPGSYYLFGNPWAGTNFMIDGIRISLDLTLSNPDPSGAPILVTANSTVPDLSVAGTTLFDLPTYGIKITTTGITGADRMSFGWPPGAFQPDGMNDYVLKLEYLVSGASVPEPATWAMMVCGVALAGFSLRRRAAVRAA